MPAQAPTSVRFVLVAVLLVLLVGAVGGSGALLVRYANLAVDQVQGRLEDELIERIVERVESFAATPVLLTQLDAERYERGELDVEQILDHERHFIAQLRVVEDISYTYIGTERGDFVGAERMADGSLKVWRVDGEVDGISNSFAVKEDGQRGAHLQTMGEYDPRTRPWYTRAKDLKGPVWTDVYTFGRDKLRLGVTAASPVFDADGELLAVTACDLKLAHIDAFLSELEVGSTGRAWLTDAAGLLLGSSSESPSMRSEGGETLRIAAADSADPLIAAAASYLQRGKQGRLTVAGDEILIRTRIVGERAGLSWRLYVAIPSSDFTGPIDRSTRTTGMLFVVILMIALGSAFWVARAISGPIGEISIAMDRLGRLELDHEPAPLSRLAEIASIQESLARMQRGLGAFAKYVPAALVRRLIAMDGEARPGMQATQATLFFSDLVGFTAIAEVVDSDRLVRLVGGYLDAFSQEIIRTEGTVDKYIGDAVMAFWNAPDPVAGHPLRACEAALACQARLIALQPEFAAEGIPTVEARIGVHTGPVLVGNVGSSERLNYTVLGDTVNLAARLESLSKRYKTSILISEQVVAACGDAMVHRPVDIVAVKGRQHPTVAYELLARRVDASAETLQLAARHAAAFESYRGGDFGTAAEGFREILSTRAGDGPSAVLLARCEALVAAPPGPDWSPVQVLTEK